VRPVHVLRSEVAATARRPRSLRQQPLRRDRNSGRRMVRVAYVGLAPKHGNRVLQWKTSSEQLAQGAFSLEASLAAVRLAQPSARSKSLMPQCSQPRSPFAEFAKQTTCERSLCRTLLEMLMMQSRPNTDVVGCSRSTGVESAMMQLSEQRSAYTGIHGKPPSIFSCRG